MLRSLLPTLTLALTAACNPSQAASTEPVEPVADDETEVVAESETQTDEAADHPAEDEGGVAAENGTTADSAPTVASLWRPVVETFATEDGGFRYEALMADETQLAGLQQAVTLTATTDPSSMTRDEQLAFYINAYNLLTVASVIELWPVESVLAEDGFFDGREHTVAGNSMTLNGLENEIIRAQYGEPRIHFAVNCASTGCPPLMPRIWAAETLDEDLARQTRAYVQSTTQIDQAANTVNVSQIFEWFEGDFTDAGGVRGFIADHIGDEHAEFVRADTTTIGFFDYDWTLNQRP